MIYKYIVEKFQVFKKMVLFKKKKKIKHPPYARHVTQVNCLKEERKFAESR